jgi:hypothetical protein
VADQRRSGPARLLKPHADTYAGIALATSAAHAADWVKDVQSPQRDAMVWLCFTAMLAGFSLAAYRLARPRI